MSFGLRAGHEPLWLDETYSSAMAGHGFLDVLRLTTQDVHPPLYYLILKLFTLAFGDSALALRLPSIASAVGLVALGAGPVRRVWDVRTGWLFALLLLSSSGILCFAQEARMYTLASFLVTGAVLYGHLAVRDGRRPDFFAFAAFTWAASLSHYFALVAVGMNALVLMIGAATRARPRLRPLALTVGLAGLGFLPWAPFFWAQVNAVAKDFWVPAPSLELLVFGLVAPFSYKYEDVPYPWQAVAASALIAGIVATTLLSKRLRGAGSRVFASLQLIAVFALTLGFSLLFSLLIRPIYMPRYLIVCAGLLLLVGAAGLARLPSRFALGTTALLVALGLPAWWQVQTRVFNGPFIELALAVQKTEGAAPVLVHNAFPFSFSLFPSWHAVPDVRHVVLAPPDSQFDLTGGGLYAAEGIGVIESIEELDDVPRIWIVDGPGPAPSEVSALESSPRWEQVGSDIQLEEPMSWVKLTVRRFERRGFLRAGSHEAAAATGLDGGPSP